jgi:hypothetical protein
MVYELKSNKEFNTAWTPFSCNGKYYHVLSFAEPEKEEPEERQSR